MQASLHDEVKVAAFLIQTLEKCTAFVEHAKPEIYPQFFRDAERYIDNLTARVYDKHRRFKEAEKRGLL